VVATLVDVLVLVEELVLSDVDVLVLVEVVVVDVGSIVLVVTPGQPLKSIVQSGRQTRPPPAEPPLPARGNRSSGRVDSVGHETVPKSVPSHSSPCSLRPLPQKGAVWSLVLVVLVALLLVLWDVLVEVLVVLDVVDDVDDGRGVGQLQSSLHDWPSSQSSPSQSSSPPSSCRST